MKKKITLPVFVMSILLTVSLLLISCSPQAIETAQTTDEGTTQATAEAEPEDASAAEPSAATEVSATTASEPAETTEEGPVAGGHFVYAGYPEPTTLDPALGSSSVVTQYLGASLVTLTPDGDIIPYLAESWDVTEDNLTWTFHLRNDVKFTDGSPLTAHDFAWTFNRALNPETASPVMGSLFGNINKIEATDDYTLVMTYNTPNASLLFTLADSGYMQPLSQAAFESGVTYDRDFVGVGPFQFKEWVTGDHITFERNPDFAWAPEFGPEGAAYLDTIEFRFIPEYATIMAGLEAGEIDATNLVATQDVQRMKDIGGFNIIESTKFGIWPGIWFNLSAAPFDNLQLRQALSYAIDRESIRDVVYSGFGQIVSGPLNSGTFGYSEEVEASGYSHDLAKAAELMTNAGYTLNADNKWEKDGQPLQFTVQVGTMEETFGKIAEVVQSQWEQFGIDITLELSESAFNNLLSGDYTVTIIGVDWAEGGEFMRLIFHSQQLNLIRGNDAQLDALLDTVGTTMDTTARQEVIDQAALYIMQNAYVITTVAKPQFMVINSRAQVALFKPTGDLYFYDIYIK